MNLVKPSLAGIADIDRFRSRLFISGWVLMFLVPWLFWNVDTAWLELVSVGLILLAGMALFFSFFASNDFLYPFRYGFTGGRYLTERRSETTFESLQSSQKSFEEYFRLFDNRRRQRLIFILSTIAALAGFGALGVGLVVFKWGLYNSLPPYRFIRSGLVLFCLHSIFLAGSMVVVLGLYEIFLHIALPRAGKLPSLKIEQLRLFKTMIGERGLTYRLGFEEIFLNITAYTRLAFFLNDAPGRASLDVIRYWQSSRLYIDLAIQVLGHSEYTNRIMFFLDYLDNSVLGMPALKDGAFDPAECPPLAGYWEEEGFNLADYPYLRRVPSAWVAAAVRQQ